MIKGKTILAIIPARGGSKGIPRKNIKMLAGKPLIAWTIEEAKKSKYVDRLILSSEDEEIIEVAQKWGCEVPFVRPKELAQDNTPGIEPILHAVNLLEKQYNYVCILQPTSPLRKVNDIDGCIEKCVKMNATSCVSVTEVNKHPYWTYSLDSNNKLIPFSENKQITLRQDLPKIYSLNGAVYFISTNELIKYKQLINTETIAYLMQKQNSLDIDDYIDFKIAELFFKKNSNHDN